ncbi:unnamed protein product [Chondrus crispus]|uniref:NAD-dependent epimerase/dehydratase domain-containing protein n=1 Tax=Chondrus crispus TaxID=2769 RepID=R7QFZ1_CHOCR|nr:unnamed protein product [Chondrus crispus]CDF36376.1 unnamed protein product [Chondrus crispus]|eukprot:XP_005716195.1 unnamed protein product [Chondrus crispus]
MTRCNFGGCRVEEYSSFWRWIVDFLTLYVFGCYELLRQLISSSYPHARHCEPAPPSGFGGTNSLILLTGCSTGIGYELLKQLLAAELDVVAITHNQDAGLPRKCKQVVVDFGSTSSTENGCITLSGIVEELGAKRPVILVHCAAVLHPKTNANYSASTIVTRTLTINLLMPMLFVKRLSELLSGIVWIGSSTQYIAPNLFDSQCPMHVAKTPFSAYPLSKLLAFVFAERWSIINSKPVVVIHPGVVATGLYRDERGLVGKILRRMMPFFAWTPAFSARRILQLVSYGGFFHHLEKRFDPSGAPQGSIPVYWDSVTMGPGLLPLQILDQGQRNKIAEALSHITERRMASERSSASSMD